MAHNVVITRAVAALNVDSYNRSVVYASGDIDNGSVFTLSRTTANSLPFTPAIAEATDTGLWMACAPEVVYVDKTQGLTVDPRDYTNKANKVFDAILLQKGDIIEITGIAPSGSAIADIATKSYLIPDVATADPVYAGTFGLKAADSAGSGFALKKIGTSVLHIGDGAIAPAAVTTYVYEVVNN